MDKKDQERNLVVEPEKAIDFTDIVLELFTGKHVEVTYFISTDKIAGIKKEIDGELNRYVVGETGEFWFVDNLYERLRFASNQIQEVKVVIRTTGEDMRFLRLELFVDLMRPESGVW